MAITMFNSILIVCTGNICRSPIAERLLRSILKGRTIDSAGTDALVGHAADSSAVAVASKHGVSLEDHKGQQFTSSLAQKYELILVMERKHLEKIGRISPEARGKTMLLGHWMNGRDIPDPYRKSDEAFESVYTLIDKSCQDWVEKLSD
ncbi:TPA: protein tyrosine phosphatase [Raoultella ornithinolytica]|jgi:protein-tyrosine phosphatase|nr:protein tyrosine phosphatase [Raoultella ornithinolytica]MEB6436259.1 protein tyrosine phosphatase [Raoultella ornithinolytica]HBH8229537.1 protein tyrosine phosphatase [Raoultella ornithinolytica]HDX8327798.1 protein tyrosine phosphatase [Raoultella ornithinolytica CD1_MRS_4]